MRKLDSGDGSGGKSGGKSGDRYDLEYSVDLRFKAKWWEVRVRETLPITIKVLPHSSFVYTQYDNVVKTSS